MKYFAISSEHIKNRAISFAEALHQRVFGHGMSPMMRSFLKHLSWSFFGIFLSATVLFVVNILAARVLGPDGYGKYNFVISLANILSVILLFGFDTTAIKFIVQGKSNLEKNQHLSNSFLVFLAFCFVALISLLFSVSIEEYFSIGNEIFIFVVIFSIVMSLRSLLDSYIRSFEMFSFQTKVRLMESLFILFVFVAFYFVFRETSYRYYLESLMLGSLIASLLFLWKIRMRFIGMNLKKLGTMWPYIKTNFFLTALGVFMTSFDKIYIGKFIGTRDLGVYSAYILASTIFVGQIILVLNNVFSPMVSSIEDKNAIIKKIDKIALLLFVPGTLVIGGISVMIIKMLGKSFEYNHLYIFIFSFLAFLQIPGSFYKSIVSANIETCDRLKQYSYYMFIVLAVYYIFIYVKNLNSMFYVVVAYFLYLVINFLIMRVSCRNYVR